MARIKTNIYTKERNQKISLARKGMVFSEQHRKRLSDAHKGKVSLRKGTKLTPEQRIKCGIKNKGKKLTEEHKQKLSMAFRGRYKGEKSHFWKGGVTPKNLAIRMSLEYKLWRKAIFERDNFTCLWCGQYGGRLNADHIKPFFLFPELRFALDNGRTLCENCHKTTETFGKNFKHYDQ